MILSIRHQHPEVNFARTFSGGWPQLNVATVSRGLVSNPHFPDAVSTPDGTAARRAYLGANRTIDLEVRAAYIRTLCKGDRATHQDVVVEETATRPALSHRFGCLICIVFPDPAGAVLTVLFALFALYASSKVSGHRRPRSVKYGDQMTTCALDLSNTLPEPDNQPRLCTSHAPALFRFPRTTSS